MLRCDDQVLLAVRFEIPLLLAHEDIGSDPAAARGAVEFEKVLKDTPSQLLAEGIYTKIAIPLKGGYLRSHSLAMLSAVLAATRLQRGARGGGGRGSGGQSGGAGDGGGEDGPDLLSVRHSKSSGDLLTLEGSFCSDVSMGDESFSGGHEASMGAAVSHALAFGQVR